MGKSEKNVEQSWLALTLLTVFVLIFTSMKAIRLPISYPASLYAVNYDQGFIKRALVGSILFPGDTPISYAVISLVSLIMFATLVLLLSIVSAQILRLHPELFLVVLLYASSFSVVFLASTVGYFDHILLILAILSIFPKNTTLRVFLVTILGGVAIFIHEASIVMVMPLMYFSAFLKLRSFGYVRAISGLTIIVSIHAVLTYLVGVHGTIGAAESELLKEAVQARADFELIDLPFEVISTVPMAEAQKTAQNINIIAHVDSIIAIIPVLAPLLAVIFVSLRQEPVDLIVILFAIVAALSPIALRAFGHDLHRWDSIALCTSFLTLSIVLREVVGNSQIQLPWRVVTPFLYVLLIMGASTSVYLFLDQDIRGFPFLGLRSSLFDWLGK